jgi:hypothetical protein
MGQPSTSAPDIAAAFVSTALTASGQSTSPIAMTGAYNVSLAGTFTATAVLERTFDGGANWLPVPDSTGTALQAAAPMSAVLYEPEDGVLYRWRLSAYTSGTVIARISR